VNSTWNAASNSQKGSSSARISVCPRRSTRPGASQCACCQRSNARCASVRLTWKGTTRGATDP